MNIQRCNYNNGLCDKGKRDHHSSPSRISMLAIHPNLQSKFNNNMQNNKLIIAMKLGCKNTATALTL